MKALLDTNFLMIPGKFKVDILSELLNLGYTEVFTLDIVVKELNGLSALKGKESRYAKIGLAFIKNGNVSVLKTGGEDADEEILNLAKTGEYAICTQDSDLVHEIKEETEARIIMLRQGKYLVETRGV